MRCAPSIGVLFVCPAVSAGGSVGNVHIVADRIHGSARIIAKMSSGLRLEGQPAIESIPRCATKPLFLPFLIPFAPFGIRRGAVWSLNRLRQLFRPVPNYEKASVWQTVSRRLIRQQLVRTSHNEANGLPMRAIRTVCRKRGMVGTWRRCFGFFDREFIPRSIPENHDVSAELFERCR
jgi:hypothetical protein